MKLSAYVVSDRGRNPARPINEDSSLVELSRGLFAVADGLGGHAAGERASRIAVDTLAAAQRDPLPPELTAEARLCAWIGAAHANIQAAADADPQLRRMGTTLTALLFHDHGAHLGHVGDSRAYLLRAGAITQLTRDHTLAQDLVDQGMLSAEEARTSRNRHALTNVLGVDLPEPDVIALTPAPGDLFILCSDGLTEHVSDEDLAVVASAHPPSEVPQRLVDLANERGGSDNITVLLVVCSATC